MDVKGKKAVVIGGTSGIGLATTKKLAAAGASVVAVSRDPSKAKDIPSGVELKACDTRDGEAMAKLLKECGPYDILVSAATGGGRAFGPFVEMDMNGFKSSFDKLWGYANVVRFGTEHLAQDGCAVLVSGTPARNPKPGQVALSCVGAAVEALTRQVAREISPRRINVVSPGLIDTPMSSLQGDERKAFYEKGTANHLIKRAGSAEEVADGIMFVIQNDFVTGTTVDVDGGWLHA